MQLLIITEKERERWLENFDYTVKDPESKSTKIKYTRAAKAAKTLTSSFERQSSGILNRLFKLGVHFVGLSAENNTTIDALIQDARTKFPRFRMDEDEKRAYTFQLVAPSQGELILDPTSTVGDVGLQDGDLLVLRRGQHYKMLDRRQSIADFHNPKYDVSLDVRNRLRDIMRTVLDPEEKQFRYHNHKIFCVLLYTQDHLDIALWVRQYFDVILQWTGRVVTFYTLEMLGDGTESADFWRGQLTPAQYRAYSLLGWSATWPYSAETIHPLTEQLNVNPAQLPCLVFFDDILAPNKLVVPLSRTDYEADIYTALDSAENALQGIDISGISNLLGTTDKNDTTPFEHLKANFSNA